MRKLLLILVAMLATSGFAATAEAHGHGHGGYGWHGGGYRGGYGGYGYRGYGYGGYVGGLGIGIGISPYVGYPAYGRRLRQLLRRIPRLWLRSGQLWLRRLWDRLWHGPRLRPWLRVRVLGPLDDWLKIARAILLLRTDGPLRCAVHSSGSSSIARSVTR